MSQLGRKRSVIWQYYTQINPNKARCSICGKEYSYAGGSTSNLAMHLNSKHPEIEIVRDRQIYSSAKKSKHKPARLSFVNVKEEKRNGATSGAVNDSMLIGELVSVKPTSTSTFDAKPTPAARQHRLNRLLMEMIVKDLHPFSMIEDNGFRKFVAGLDPMYVIPAPRTINAELLPASYNRAIDDLVPIVSETEAVCLTTDTWTTGSNENFITVTAHFISTDFKLRSCLLECISYADCHTAEHLRDEIIRVGTEWGIGSKIVCVVTDNTPIITTAVQMAKLKHLGCFAHTLNLVVQNAVPLIESLKIKVKSIVEHFDLCTASADTLESFQLQMNPDKQPLKLTNEDTILWNAMYTMFQRICDIEEPLEAAIAVLRYPVEPLTADEWAAVKEISNILKPFHAVASELSTSTTVSASKVILLSCGLILACKNVEDRLATETGKDFMAKLSEGLQTGFGTAESVPLLARATFLDPRFKKDGFYTDSCYTQVYNDITALVQRRIMTDNLEQQMSSSQTAVEHYEDSSDLIWGHYEHKKADSVKNPQAAATSLIRQYLEEPNISRNEDPLAWWRDREPIYKELAAFAKCHLCIVGTSIPSDRVFSKIGQQFSARRSHLDAKIIKMVMFLNHNYKLLEEYSKT